MVDQFEFFVVKQKLASIKIILHEIFCSKAFCYNFAKVTYWFPKKTTSTNAFLAFCPYLDATIDLQKHHSEAKLEQETFPYKMF